MVGRQCDRIIGLESYHLLIDAVGFDQLRMRPLLHDLALIENQDYVGVLDGTESMSDNKRGSRAQEQFQTLLDRLFALAVEVAGCLVENEYFWIGENGPCDRDPLTLSTAEFEASFSDTRLVSAR